MNKATLTLREQALYDLLQDDKSRQIFMARKRFAETGDDGDLWALIDHQYEFEEIIDKLRSAKYLLYGAGAVCKKLVVYLAVFSALDNCIGIWDRDPSKAGKDIGGIPVSLPDATADFEYALPAVSEKFKPELFDEILNYLHGIGVPDERIIKPFFSVLESADVYFDKEIIASRLKGDEVFIDGGCYDFFTSKRFIDICDQRGISIKAVHAFEPDARLAEKCRENSAPYPFAKIHQVGLWSENKLLPFYTATESGSLHIGDSGNELRVVALDDHLPQDETVTFIKFDIEGAEMEGLRGAAQIIQRDKPKLAICIYHKPLDYIEITEYIHSLVPEYKMFIRVYGPAGSETTLYCVME